MDHWTDSVESAISAVQQAMSHPGLSSEWTSILCAKLRRPSELCPDIRRVLEKNGWSRSQFRSPPVRELLLRDLRDLAQSDHGPPTRIDDERRFDRQYVIEEKEKPVGEGTYGAVHRAFCNRLQKTVAIKRVKMEHEDEGMPSTAIREVAVLKAADHPNVVKLLDVACSPGRLHLVFEFVDANLKQYMKKFGLRLEPEVVRSLQKQLMNGIDYCHARRIIHRDLKPQNILVDGEDHLKIADFGMARAFNLPLPKYTHEVVTTWYRSPEILFGCEEYSLGVDVWSAGCILGEMATGAALFHGDSEIDTIFQIFRKLGTPTEADWPGLSSLPDFKPTFPQWRRRPWTEIRNIASQLGSAGVRLLDSMLRYDPACRVSAKQTLQHEYFMVDSDTMDAIMAD
ncbi:CDC28 [Symbiodinium microadriaticum]|nr:CDC28 [Symbiodinium microadriaticum]